MKRLLRADLVFCAFISLIDLSKHFADCLIEQPAYEEAKVAFEMQIFKETANMYDKCRKEYENDNSLYEGVWAAVHHPTVTYYQKMEEITKYLRVDIMCGGMIYDNLMPNSDGKNLAILWVVQVLALEQCNVFLQGHFHHKYKGNENVAKKFALAAAYLAAFGANQSHDHVYESELYKYMCTEKSLRQCKGLKNFQNTVDFLIAHRPHVLAEGHVPHLHLVKEIRFAIFEHYNSEKKTFDIKTRDLQKTFRILDLLATMVDTYVADILFAKNYKFPGSRLGVLEYNNEQLWDSKDILKIIDSINIPETITNQHNLPDKSIIIDLLRETELLKMKFHRRKLGKEMMDAEIDEIKKGFDDNSSLRVDILAKSSWPTEILLFSKYTNDGTHVLANNETVTNLFSNRADSCRLENLVVKRRAP